MTFQVDRTDSQGGTTGEVAVKSGYTIVANQTRTLPKPPTTFVFTPSSNFNDTLKLDWSGAKAGTNNPIKEYWVVFQTSPDAAAWTPAETIHLTDYSATSGSNTVDTSGWDTGVYCRVAIRPIGTYDVGGATQGDLAYSNTIRKMVTSDPVPPSISINVS